MNLYDKITGNDMHKLDKEYQLRIEKLPVDYQNAWRTLNQEIWKFSDFSGRNLYPILDGLLGLFEESAAEGLAIEAVTGGNVDAFISEIANIEGGKSYRDKLRDQLNRTIKKKLGR